MMFLHFQILTEDFFSPLPFVWLSKTLCGIILTFSLVCFAFSRYSTFFMRLADATNLGRDLTHKNC